jgi:hypothetical protein
MRFSSSSMLAPAVTALGWIRTQLRRYNAQAYPFRSPHCSFRQR